MNSLKYMVVIFASMLVFACQPTENRQSSDEPWSSYLHDQQNSGVSSETLSFPLQKTWERAFQNPPQPAWPAPAKQDYFNGKRKLEPLVTYDRAFQPVVVGERLFLASSANNSIACYDVQNGELIWKYYTGAPNRVAPLWYKQQLFVGSDDGFVYCLNAANGTLQWKKSFGRKRKMIGNGRIISSVPIRTGIVAKGDTVFIAAGLLPEEHVSINACHTLSGELIWSRPLKELAPQGYPVLTDSLWYIPNSRVQPMAFSTRNGELSQQLKGDGGDNLSVIDGRLVFGVDWKGELNSKRLLESVITGYKVTGQDDRLFVASDFSLTAIDVHLFAEKYKQQESLEAEIKQRLSTIKENELTNVNPLDSLRRLLEQSKQEKFVWQSEISKPFAMINAANAIVTGQQDLVVAYHPESGEEIWKQQVNGRPYGMAICGQQLFISTDMGYLYCFGQKDRQIQIVEGLYNDSRIARPEGSDQKIHRISRLLPREKGFVLVADDPTYTLVEKLAQASKYQIVGVIESVAELEAARTRLDQAGLYGIRTTLLAGAWHEQSFSDYLFNVVIWEKKMKPDKMSALSADLFRIVSPSGGRILLSKRNARQVAEVLLNAHPNELKLIEGDDYWVLERQKLPGSGEWTHLYANPANTASTTDKYASDTVRSLWFGQPGPREMSDRHHRAASPLFKDGILFIPGDNGVLAADAYNGTLLWKKDIPHFRRIKISRDAGNVAVGEDGLFAVADNFCYMLDGVTGKEKKLIRVPQLGYGSEDAHWGYLATEGDVLFGSGRKPAAIFNRYSRLDWSEYSRLVTSDFLFGINIETGKKIWSYKGGVILTGSICVGDDKLFFVESHHPEALNDDDGLIPFNTLKQDMKVVAIDALTGEVIWTKTYDFAIIEHILYGSYADGFLVMAGSGNVNGSLWYGNYAFNGLTGDLVWKNTKMHLSWTNGSHGEQIHRTLIMDGVVYTEPFAFDLKTGKQKEEWKLSRNGHSCGTLSGADGILYFRATNPAVCIPGETDQGQQLNNVTRPGCWINMIPAGGLLMIPEASSGCSCNFPLQMSIVYQPVKK